MMYGYIVGDGEMQLIESNYDNSCEVYNFKDSYNYNHSHIHYYNMYDPNAGKRVYRYLSNPQNGQHKFYPLEQYAMNCLQVASVYDFPFTYESLYKAWLNNLSKEQLIELQNYLAEKKENVTLSKKR